MTARIAIPEPTSLDPEYNGRALPPYLEAIRSAGATPVVIGLNASPRQVARELVEVQGILLPGSRYDVDPQKYGEGPIPECASPDPSRTAVDELLLQDGFNLYKPILAICYGIQALSVWRNGSLIQDIDAQLQSTVNHRPGRDVQRAHPVSVSPGTKLWALAPAEERANLWVNSSHHQAVRVAGDNLRVSAISPDEGVIEAVELDSDDHWVLGVQWHPERTYQACAFSHAIFSAFVQAAETWRPRRIEESVVRS
jgi:putative glutamine amidotransferase